ncbi:peptidoglycan-binding protein [Salipaludibacillus sp. LMS25]|jgi:cell wall-associated NlpC family hydrolase|uniref:C40 family peptidase n=1 Tax=Salipaludibacillus sp. LMS25 TaxID=2924031 RepID=UPI0020D05BDA|nr:peptidoglycan-binding protein [Salipaludibacillus sp. LMS25]UTR14932.1 peptidoglycan-binding protein [Salipaludibacillus sp. LMS25]
MMITMGKKQKRLILGSAMATATLLQSTEDSESLTNSTQEDVKLNHLSVLHFTKGDGKLEKSLTTPVKLEVVNSEPTRIVVKNTDMQSVWPANILLTKGASGKKVKTIQSYLGELGYYVSKPDGVFGSKTEEAVRHYQKDHGLKIDGKVGVDTITHLVGTKSTFKNDHYTTESLIDAELPPVYRSTKMNSAPKSNTPDVYINDTSSSHQQSDYLAFGDESHEVKQLQQQLAEAGYYTAEADGVYGSYTQQAVRQLQKDHQLSVDGLAGKEVIHFLKNNLDELKQQTASTKTKSSEKSSDKTNTVSNESSLETTHDVIATAKDLIGIPYEWGGTTTNGFDCSGFLQYVYDKSGISLPRTVAEIWEVTSPVSSPQRGDIVFFETYQKGPSHAGIYLGNDQFIHAGSSSGVSIADLQNPYWQPRYIETRRLTK